VGQLLGMQIHISERDRRSSLPLQFKTTFLDFQPNNTAIVVRIVHAFSNPQGRNRNRSPKAVLSSVLEVWPCKSKTRYLITTGGFLRFEWPHQASGNSSALIDTDVLIEAARETCNQLLTPALRKRLAKVADYISLGADSNNGRQGNTRQSVELVFLVDLHSAKEWVTGKSYPASGREEQSLASDG
jgi:hypothetical protein